MILIFCHLFVQKAESRGLIFDAHGVRQNVLILFLKHYYSITPYYHLMSQFEH